MHREGEIVNPCEDCIHEHKGWTEEPCYRCGEINDYAWYESNKEEKSG